MYAWGRLDITRIRFKDTGLRGCTLADVKSPQNVLRTFKNFGRMRAYELYFRRMLIPQGIRYSDVEATLLISQVSFSNSGLNVVSKASVWIALR